MSLRLISKDDSKQMPFKLNFGCGNTINSRMVNIDAHISDTIKRRLSDSNDSWVYEGLWTNPHEFPVKYFSLVEAFDVLEHFHPDKIGNILYCFRCCMNKGAELRIKVPDFEGMAHTIARMRDNREMSIEWLRKFRRLELIWMAPYVHGGIGHQSIWTKAMAKHRIEGEGFEVTSMETKNLTLSIEAKRL